MRVILRHSRFRLSWRPVRRRAAFCALAAVICAAFPALAARSYGENQGYLFDVATERRQTSRELAFAMPPSEPKNLLQQKIFNEELTKEFRLRYEQRFGMTDAQQAYYAPNKYSYYSDLYGFRGTPEQNNDARREFGEYMVRRLAEWHVDNYAKSDPSVRPVWEAKERLSSLKVEVQTFRFDARYSFAGNIVDLNCYNPYADAKVTLQGIGGAGLGETILSLSRPIAKASAVESLWYMNDGVAQLIGRRALSPTMTATLTASTFTKPIGTRIRESLYLGGLTYVF